MRINDILLNVFSFWIWGRLREIRYNSIEGQILGEVVNVINGFPNFKEEIKNKLNIEGALQFIKVIFNETLDSLLKYQNYLNEDIDTYINKLVHYTFINGLD